MRNPVCQILEKCGFGKVSREEDSLHLQAWEEEYRSQFYRNIKVAP